MCEICDGDGIIRVGGLFGKESVNIAPCDHCPRGAEEKIKMELIAEARKVMRDIERYKKQRR